MKTTQAKEFAVEVINEGGCVMTEIGGQYSRIEDALRAAKKITRNQCERAGAFNCHNGAGVEIQILACDNDDKIAADGCDGMIIWTKWI